MMAKKLILTDKMKEKRLAFCRQYGHWTPDQWKKVMFSDESHFEINCFRRNLCRRPVRSDRFDQLFTRKSAKHPAKVMVWACFSWQGRGAIEFLKKGDQLEPGTCRSWTTIWKGSWNCGEIVTYTNPNR